VAKNVERAGASAKVCIWISSGRKGLVSYLNSILFLIYPHFLSVSSGDADIFVLLFLLPMLRTGPSIVIRPLAVLVDPEKIMVLGRALDPLPLEELAGRRSRATPTEALPSPLAKLLDALRDRAAPDEVRNAPRPLMPRPIRGGDWALPMLVLVRAQPQDQVRPGYQPLGFAIDEMARELGDSSFALEAMRAFTESVLGDEFTGRVAGDTARTGHAARTMPAMLPWLVACLPDVFSLSELHHAVLACLGGGDTGSDPRMAESPSNFRRRVHELVLSGVLEELPSASRSSDPDRPGRPPRMFRFSPMAWAAWLRRRSGSGGTPMPPDAWHGAMPPPSAAMMSPSPPDAALHELMNLRRAAMNFGSPNAPVSPQPGGPAPDSDPDSMLWQQLRALLEQHQRARMPPGHTPPGASRRSRCFTHGRDDGGPPCR